MGSSAAGEWQRATPSRVDGGPFQAGFTPVSGDGAHVVDARDSDGNTATAVYLIDTTAPTITHSISPAAPDGTDGWYKTKTIVTFSCNDNVSGIATCTSPITVGDSGGSQIVAGTAVDHVLLQTTDSATVTKIDSTGPTGITFSGIQGGTLYPVNSLPASSAISCSATDVLSGFKSCVVTGYSNAIGVHTLTANATDNAGSQSTNTLT
jgi:hypothetical protein